MEVSSRQLVIQVWTSEEKFGLGYKGGNHQMVFRPMRQIEVGRWRRGRVGWDRKAAAIELGKPRASRDYFEKVRLVDYVKCCWEVK